MHISGHEVEFFECREIGQGGPEACAILIDGQWLERKKYDPSPMPYRSGIIVPARKQGLFGLGYALCFIDFVTLESRFVSKVLPYMRLVGVYDDCAEVLINTYEKDVVRIKIKDKSA